MSTLVFACDMSCRRPSTVVSSAASVLSASAAILPGLSTKSVDGAQVHFNRRRLAESGSGAMALVEVVSVAPIGGVVNGAGMSDSAAAMPAALSVAAALAGSLGPPKLSLGGVGLRASISSAVINDCTG